MLTIDLSLFRQILPTLNLVMAEEKVQRLMSEARLVPFNMGDKEKEEEDEDLTGFDTELYSRGAGFFHDNFFSVFVSMLCGLISLLSMENIASVLYTTRRWGALVISRLQCQIWKQSGLDNR